MANIDMSDVLGDDAVSQRFLEILPLLDQVGGLVQQADMSPHDVVELCFLCLHHVLGMTCGAVDEESCAPMPSATELEEMIDQGLPSLETARGITDRLLADLTEMTTIQ